MDTEVESDTGNAQGTCIQIHRHAGTFSLFDKVSVSVICVYHTQFKLNVSYTFF